MVRMRASLAITLALLAPLFLLPRSAAAVPSSDQIADSLFSSLQHRNYTAAFALFDDRMKTAVPEEKLQALWDGQSDRLGALVSWQKQAGDPVQGHEVRLASLQFERGELKAMVVVDPAAGAVSGFFVRPGTPPASGHPAYADTTQFKSLDVSVISDRPPLGGTLTLPAGKGPFPAAVLVHGSGPQDRDETIGANKVFRDIAEGLSSKGIAVLRYDKRTLRYPQAMASNPTIDGEVVLDAVSAVQLLASRQDVDPKRVFVIGHSLGALLAPEIGVRAGAGSVAGVALMAPPGRKPWELVIAQMRFMGAPDTDLVNIETSAAALAAGNAKQSLLGAPGSYWLDWARRDGPAQAKKLGRPVLVLHGERDFQVTDEDIAIWKKALAGAPKVEFIAYPALSHLFIAGTGKPNPAEYDTPGHVDPKVIDDLSQFIQTAPSGTAAPRLRRASPSVKRKAMR